MRVISVVALAAFMTVAVSLPARAEFIISNAILEFTRDGPSNQDIDLISRSKDNDYIVTEVSEITHPGQPDETRRAIDDPAGAALLVTPDKTILSGGNRKVLRFVLLKQPDDREHIYRVTIRPVIKGLQTGASKLGLKILVGYEVLVIVRPAVMKPGYDAVREGNSLKITNRGNTNILFQNGQQCADAGTCKMAPVLRVYAGTTATIALPGDGRAVYSVWDGQETSERQFP